MKNENLQYLPHPAKISMGEKLYHDSMSNFQLQHAPPELNLPCISQVEDQFNFTRGGIKTHNHRIQEKLKVNRIKKDNMF